MQRTLNSYSDDIMAGLGAIPEKDQFFFSAWNCQHLYNQYGKFISEKLSQEDAEDVTIVLDYIWEQVDDFDNFDEDELESNIETIQEKDPDGDLDMTNTIENGISNLFGAMENTLTYLRDKETEYSAGAGLIVTNVIDCIMTNDLGLDTANPDKHFNHPLMKDEIDLQMKLIDYLKTGGQVSGNDKNIFR